VFEEKLSTELTVADLHEAMANTIRRRNTKSPDSSPWADPARVVQLRNLWEAGWSAGQIAKELGVTRNAVIGRVHRTGLPQRQTVVFIPHTTSRGVRKAPYPVRPRGEPKPRGPRPVWSRPELTPQVISAPDPYTVIPLMATTSRFQCRYIVDGAAVRPNATSLVCGAPTTGTVSWCHHHLKLISGQPRPKESLSGGGYVPRPLSGLSFRPLNGSSR
jgi:hypothetical protein